MNGTGRSAQRRVCATVGRRGPGGRAIAARLRLGWAALLGRRRGGHTVSLHRRRGEGRPMAGELAFFEIGVGDAERGRAFYEALFGWQFDRASSGHGFAITAPNMPGGMHGGDAGATPYVFFKVEDMDAALERVREL